VRIWDTHDWRERHPLRNAELALTVAFSPDGGCLAVVAGKELCLWDPRTGRLLRTCQGHTDYIITLAFSPDGRTLVSAGYEGEVKVWDARPEPLVAPLPAEPVATAVLGAAAGLRTLPIRTLPAHAGRASTVAFSPDGSRLVSAGMDGVFIVWDARTWEKLPSRPSLGGHIHRLVLSPDGQQLASAGSDATVRVWEATTGRPLFAHRGHADTILGLAYSADGRYLASASADRTVKVWDADPPPDSPARTALDPGK
jgi:WD40 repeat protein